jgi:hypothetical protein
VLRLPLLVLLPPIPDARVATEWKLFDGLYPDWEKAGDQIAKNLASERAEPGASLGGMKSDSC